MLPNLAPEDGDGGGAAVETAPAADAPAPADTSSVLYPDDKAPDPKADAAGDKPAADPKADPAADPKADETTGDWKEYVDDPDLTPEENAAAKLENDAKHPVNQIPEDGKYSLTMPEGVEVDQALLDALGPTFKDLKLSNGHAQKLADKFIEAQTAKGKEQAETWAKTITDWADTAKADPEMGGAKWDGTSKAALSAVTRFGTPELKAYLDASGGGNHPEMIRFMAKVGALIGEDKPAISESPGATVERDHASILYPNDKPKGK